MDDMKTGRAGRASLRAIAERLNTRRSHDRNGTKWTATQGHAVLEFQMNG